MDKITMEQALEAYNMIRKYCTENICYKDCFFATEESCHCIFKTVNDSDIPCNWQQLDLD